eukprot:TRINITY_DN2553_c0_g1_i3.p1 TRINITY_DN2553_c0_g1~~TRINITY_DN2553_c0_g1_i3.p1  ORF type:complete len:366 (-),score=94.67 TRINITY_DN2553_c0_g1_i3:41-1138(-)
MSSLPSLPLTVTLPKTRSSNDIPLSARHRPESRSRSCAFYGAPPPVINEDGDVIWVAKPSKLGTYATLPVNSPTSYLPATATRKASRVSFNPHDLKHAPLRPSSRFDIGVAETIGRRTKMEDSVSIYGGFFKHNDDLICLFDGHNGPDAAQFASHNFPVILSAFLSKGMEPESAMKETFEEIHKMILSEGIVSGTTAVVLFLTKDKGYIASVGDSRAVFVMDNKTCKQVTKDHRTKDKEECEAVMKRGGTLLEVGGVIRVDGKIAVTRALGDPVVAKSLGHSPDIFSFAIDDNMLSTTKYIVLACDGIWDFLSNEEITALLTTEKPLEDPECAAMELRGAAFSNNSDDNISVIIVDISTARKLFE